MGQGEEGRAQPDPTFSHRPWNHRFTAQLVESPTPQEKTTETFAMAAAGSHCPHLTQKVLSEQPRAYVLT